MNVRQTVIPVLALALATLGVLAMTAAPRPGGELLAVFDAQLSRSELADRIRTTRLPVISMDANARHAILKDVSGDGIQRLRRSGAQLVVDARMASFCRSGPGAKG